MKKYIFVFLLISRCTVHAQHTEILQSPSAGLTIQWNGSDRLTNGNIGIEGNTGTAFYRLQNDVALLSVLPASQQIADTAAAGVFFNNIPQYKQGVILWRYKPWNSWTKPIALSSASAMPGDDVQFYYWQYKDGVYGACVPLSGHGFRTTIGSNGKKWGSKAVSYGPNKNVDTVPAMAVAFGKDPFELFERIYRTALQSMGKGENLRSLKKFPEPFNYIGWCTWNASDNGEKLNEELLVNAAKSFSEHQFPLGWILVDDGWFQQDERRLRSFDVNPEKFPNGFAPVIKKLKGDYGIKYMGVWHAFNGLWNGIDTASALGRHFHDALYSWTQHERPDIPSPMKTYYFIRPGGDSLDSFYDQWHKMLKQQGFDFVKVDNQLVVEKMAKNNYPIFTLSNSMHKALYRSVNKYFDGAVINCMDMTADAYLNFGTSAVARSEEDYFPYHEGETYNLQRGNAAAHVLQAIYNSIYFGQMVYPDFDIFQSHNPNATFHAIARALNCGPIYITDNVGQQRFEVLKPLVFSDGRIIRSETPLLPTADCLFQVQDHQLFKAFSMVGGTGLIGAWNAADVNSVKGSISPKNVHGIHGNDFAVYEYFSKKLRHLKKSESISVTLDRMGYKLYYVVPCKNGFAALGLTDKYNAPATIMDQHWNGNSVAITLYEGGEFSAYSQKAPSKVLVNGKPFTNYQFSNNMLTLRVPQELKPVITLSWNHKTS